jgi:hypothetical protein
VGVALCARVGRGPRREGASASGAHPMSRHDGRTGQRAIGCVMGHAARHRLVTGFLAGVGAFTGLVMALVVVLNLHIFTGVVEGYMASPAQVVEHSVLLAVVDVLLLVAGPALAVVVVIRLRGQRSGPD